MTLHWFRPTRFKDMPVETIREILAPAGVVERKSTLGVHYYVDEDEPDALMKSIGDIIVRPHLGRIEVWPYIGVTERDLRTLYGTAELAFTKAPSKAEGWDFRQRPDGKSYWRTTISIQLDEHDPHHLLIARERTAEYDRRTTSPVEAHDREDVLR